MVTIALPGINVIRHRLADGTRKTYYYHRATGTKLPDDPTSVEFHQAVDDLNKTVPPTSAAPTGSLAALIAQYRASPEFKQLSKSSQKDYRRYLALLETPERWGHLPVRGIRRHNVIELRDEFAATPRTANYIVAVLRLLMIYAMDRDWIDVNPAASIKRLKTGEGHRPAEEHEIAAFRACWAADTVERVAFELLLNTGQRGGDVIAMVRTHYRDGVLSVVQQKIRRRVGTARARVEVPASDDLKAVLEPWLETHTHLSILVRNGAPLKGDHFRHIMREAYTASGLLADFTTHGLRYAAATRLFELGVDWGTIGEIVGHQTMQMVGKYTEKRRRARLAVDKLNRATRKDPN